MSGEAFGQRYEGSLFQLADLLQQMSDSSRLNLLKKLIEDGPMRYSELKNATGYFEKREGGRFAYHLRKVMKTNLVYLDNETKKYSITTRGAVFLTSALAAIGISASGEMSGLFRKQVKEGYTIGLVSPELDKIEKALEASLYAIDSLREKIKDVKSGKVGEEIKPIAQMKAAEEKPKPRTKTRLELLVERYGLNKREADLAEYLLESDGADFDHRAAIKATKMADRTLNNTLCSLLDKQAFKKLSTQDDKLKTVHIYKPN